MDHDASHIMVEIAMDTTRDTRYHLFSNDPDTEKDELVGSYYIYDTS